VFDNSELGYTGPPGFGLCAWCNTETCHCEQRDEYYAVYGGAKPCKVSGCKNAFTEWFNF
jgi:hypothetical protein